MVCLNSKLKFGVISTLLFSLSIHYVHRVVIKETRESLGTRIVIKSKQHALMIKLGSFICLSKSFIC